MLTKKRINRFDNGNVCRVFGYRIGNIYDDIVCLPAVRLHRAGCGKPCAGVGWLRTMGRYIKYLRSLSPRPASEVLKTCV